MTGIRPLAELPSGWSVQPLADLLSRQPSYGINAAASAYAPDAPTYIRITDISQDGAFTPSPRVSVRHPASSSYLLDDGDLVFARTGASVGKSYRYRSADGALVYAGFLIRITPDTETLDPRYFGYFVQSKQYWDWVSVMSVRSGQPGINGREYAQLPVVVPPVDEQRAIARTLSSFDGLVEATEDLIRKKQGVKQAAMQRLLSGATRLPGYSAEWDLIKLGSLGRTFGGLAGKSKDDFGSGQGRYVPFMDIMRDVVIDGRDLPRVRVADAESQNLVQVDDLLFNSSSETPDELAMCAVVTQVPEHTYLNSFSVGFRLDSRDQADPLFLAYLFRGPVGRALLYSLAQGAIRYNLSKAQFRALELRLPHSGEQMAIARIIAEMDAEIGALRARVAKTKDIKRGVMQAILSGQTRVVDAEVAA